MITVKWIQINQSYFILWNDTVLSIKPNLTEVNAWLECRNLKI